MQADDDLKTLLDRIGKSVREAIRSSEPVQEALRELETRGYTPA